MDGTENAIADGFRKRHWIANVALDKVEVCIGVLSLNMLEFVAVACNVEYCHSSVDGEKSGNDLLACGERGQTTPTTRGDGSHQ